MSVISNRDIGVVLCSTIKLTACVVGREVVVHMELVLEDNEGLRVPSSGVQETKSQRVVLLKRLMSAHLPGILICSSIPPLL